MSIRNNIPNGITALNLCCGVLGVIFVSRGRIDLALWSMFAGAVFDFLDGFAARLLKAVSPMGKELDSLADVVSFGVLPAFMLYSVSRGCMFAESWASWSSVLIAVFSGIRLAKFNVDTRQSSSFLGLPTPACALLTASLAYFVCFNPACDIALWMAGPVFVPVYSVVMSILLVCELPMFSLKMHRDDPKPLVLKRLLFLALAILSVAACVVFKLNWSLAVVFTMCCYIVKNAIYAIFKV